MHGVSKKISVFLLCFAFLGQALFAAGENQPSGTGQNTGRNQADPALLGRDISDAFGQMDSSMIADEDLSAEDAYYIGRAVGANLLTRYTPWSGNPALTSYVNKICDALAANSPRPEIYNGYHVLILDSAEINAIATPAGHIFITKGLLELASSEDMMAAIIAHEMAHIQLEHAAAIIKDVRFTQDLSAASSRSAGIASRNAPLKDRTAYFGNTVVELVNTLFQDGYAQAQEFEADNYAVGLLVLSGYEPSSLVDMLRLMERAQRGNPGGLSATHPAPADRIANVEKTVARYRVTDTRGFRQSRFISAK